MVKQPAFALIEVIVALTLLGLALLGVTGSALLAARVLREAEATERGALQALQIIDSLSQLPNAQNGARQAGRLQLVWQISQDTSGVTLLDVTVSQRDGRDLRRTSYRLTQAQSR